VLQRGPVRAGEKWVLTKESLSWSDDPALAFRSDNKFGHSRGLGPGEGCSNWEAIRDALAVVGPTAVAKWASGCRTQNA
jgi:hypothetical protein